MSWTLKKRFDAFAGPGEIKRREPRRDQEQGGGLLLLQLFPNGGATDIVFVTLFCIAAGTAKVFRVGACLEVSLFFLCFIVA